MVRVAFKVSARAARLIGRENVATSQGAVTELVKNSYDADASVCAILFLRRYPSAPKRLAPLEFKSISILTATMVNFYNLEGAYYVLREDLSLEQQTELETAFANVVDLWLVDNGHGMSADTIKTKWMVIGTDAKEVNGKSGGGRTVTGAKGIGRFALDKLGLEAELFSAVKSQNSIIHWMVNWGDFEGDGKVIDDVTAILESESRSLNDVYTNEQVIDFLPSSFPERLERSDAIDFSVGVAIKISHLNDAWDVRDSLKLRETLEALLPPKDRGDFNIYVFDPRLKEQNGWIDNFAPDQFDYKMHAVIGSSGDIEISLNRQEIEASRIRKSVFGLPIMQRSGFRPEDFNKGEITYSRNIRLLMKREEGADISDLLAIGPFEFTLYFFKLVNPSKDNSVRFPQKNFDSQKRRRWLTTSGGIRLYRDDFRVRPYGEPNTHGSDWLLLGQRNAANPAAVSRVNSWRVPPQQVAGTIHITKSANPLLADQSNREGIMNERIFSLFRDVILALIAEFERDRSTIYSAFDQAYKIDHPREQKVAIGRAVAKKVLGNTSVSVDTNIEYGIKNERPAIETIELAEAFNITSEENRELREEIQVLRGMATLGTVLVSFTHELRQIKANMGTREQRMKYALDKTISTELLNGLPSPINPYDILARWGREDEKVSRWVDFALSSVAPIKRRRRKIELNKYLREVADHWKSFLDSKQAEIRLVFSGSTDPILLAHEIDLDSIFYNLIVNSVEAFTKPSSPLARIIVISTQILGENVEIRYEDTGPGISPYFEFTEEIFEFGRSSKVDPATQAATGTGIGMWLLKSIVDDHKGTTAIMSEIGKTGFAISILLPLKKDGASL